MNSYIITTDERIIKIQLSSRISTFPLNSLAVESMGNMIHISKIGANERLFLIDLINDNLNLNGVEAWNDIVEAMQALGDSFFLSSIADYVTLQPGKNLFDKSKIVENSILNNAGNIVNNVAGWGRSPMISLPAGTYILSGIRGRQGLGLFSNESDIIPFEYFPATAMPLQFTLLIDAFVAFNVFSATAPAYSNLMLESGDTATDYEDYKITQEIKKESIFPAIEYEGIVNEKFPLKISLDPENTDNNYLEFMLSGKLCRKTFVLPGASNNKSQVFDTWKIELDKSVVHSNSDNAAPLRIDNTTLAGNHGRYGVIVELEDHGKTNLDVGSVYIAGGKEYVIVRIDNEDSFLVSSRTDDVVNTSIQQYVHVSGGTNTASFTPDETSLDQFYPCFKDYERIIYVDDVVVKEETSTLFANKNLTIVERYSILSKTSMMEFLINNSGSSTPITAYDGDAIADYSISYTFDKYGVCVMHPSVKFLETIPVNDLMFLMETKLGTSTDYTNEFYCIPRSIPFVHDSISYDFSELQPLPLNNSTRINLDSTRYLAGNLPPTRSINLLTGANNKKLGQTIGFIEEQTASPTNRPIQAATQVLQINDNDASKLYWAAVNKGAFTAAIGETYSVICYKALYIPDEESCFVIVPVRDDFYIYINFHGFTGIKTFPMRLEMLGKTISPISKSSNIEIMDSFISPSLTVKVNDNNAAWATLLVS